MVCSPGLTHGFLQLDWSYQKLTCHDLELRLQQLSDAQCAALTGSLAHLGCLSYSSFFSSRLWLYGNELTSVPDLTRLTNLTL
jgi:hypothetical protein